MSELRRTLLTGGTGFLGRHVLAELQAQGHEVWSLGRRRPALVAAARHVPLADPRDAAAIRAAIEHVRPATILHLAGSAVAPPAEMYVVNTIFAAGLLTAAAAVAPSARLFLAGTAAEYGPVAEPSLPVTEATPPAPRDAYGISKLAQTLHGLAAAELGLGVVVGRIFNAIGPGMPEHLALGAFAAQLTRLGPGGGVLLTGDLEVDRDFIEVEQAARLIIALAARPDVTGVVDLCSGSPTRLRVLVEALVNRTGLRIEIRRDPARGGITAHRRHFGAAGRLRSLGLPVPVLEVGRAMEGLAAEVARARAASLE
jgi:GDP-4-dehydro-6-deoxy-D-mannose reductase